MNGQAARRLRFIPGRLDSPGTIPHSDLRHGLAASIASQLWYDFEQGRRANAVK